MELRGYPGGWATPAKYEAKIMSPESPPKTAGDIPKKYVTKVITEISKEISIYYMVGASASTKPIIQAKRIIKDIRK